jgi:hypothetical protein
MRSRYRKAEIDIATHLRGTVTRRSRHNDVAKNA